VEDQPILIYNKLRQHFGFLNWWPGETSFEIFVGAILTQQTQWRNVELALANLRNSNSLSLEKISRMPLPRLEKLIRPSGFYKQKAARLQGICRNVMENYGNLDKFLSVRKDKLRELLLSYNGIGNETADSIILYAANKRSFVIDAYTKRAMHRINPSISQNIEYMQLKSYFEESIRGNISLYKDFHAQFVELGKNYCKTRPLCRKCPLNRNCTFGRNHIN
jgi:endonuclease III related protein